MSVLIKGMKLPDMCGHCRFATAFDCEATGNFIVDHKVRNTDCPLVEIPEPHGRLIDADEADSRYIPDFTDLTDYQQGWNDAMKRVCDNAPTIIEAEEGEQV